MPVLPTVNTLLIIISAIMVVFGWVSIVKGKVKAHKRSMITAIISAILFFITYAMQTILVGNTSFGGPEHVKIYYTIFLLFHIVLATTSAVLGAFTFILARKRNIEKHRKLGPITSILWLITAITGVMVYLFLYVIYSGGETTSIFRAIFGL